MKTFRLTVKYAIFISIFLVSFFVSLDLVNAQASNLVPNGDLETPSVNPQIPLSWVKSGYGVNTRIYTYPESGYSSEKSAKVEITSYTNGDAKWSFAEIPATSGQYLTFHDYYKSNVPSYLTVQFHLEDGTYKYLDIFSNVPASNEWQVVGADFLVPSYTSPVVGMTVFHLIKSVGYLYIDDASISEFTLINTTQNKIFNNSVEYAGNYSTIPYGWNYTYSPGITATPVYPVAGYNSNKALQINSTSYSGGSGAKWYFSHVNVLPGEEYMFADYYKSTANSYVTAQYKMNDGTYTYSDFLRLTPSPNWKRAEYTFLVPDNVLSMTVLHIIKETGVITLDDFRLRKLNDGAFSQGMVTFSFDDGYKDVFLNAMPILNNAGIKSSQYIISERVGNYGYMTSADLLALQSQGHEIGSHTKNHLYLTQLANYLVKQELAGSKTTLSNLGINQVATFVYPYGDYNDVTKRLVKESGYTGARSVRSGYNTKNTDKWALRDQHVESNTTASQIIGYIQKAVQTNTWLILELHHTDYSLDQYSNTPETLQEVVNYITSNNIPVVTMSQGLSQMNQ